MTKIYVFYHKNCFDGSMAAAIYWHHLLNTKAPVGGTQVKFVPWTYDEDIGPVHQYEGCQIVLLDMTFHLYVLTELILVAESILVIDHHPRAHEQAAIAYPNGPMDSPQTVTFITDSKDNPQSGSELTWNYLFPNAPMPDVVRWIGSGDRWVFDEPEVRRLRLAINSLGFDPLHWQRTLLDRWPGGKQNTDELVKTGAAMEKVLDKQLDYLEEACATWITIDGHKVAACNAPRFVASEMANRLLKKYSFEESPFVAILYEEHGALKFSLRARKDGRVNLTAIAARFGGSGHATAAGFSMPLHRPSIESRGYLDNVVHNQPEKPTGLVDVLKAWWNRLIGRA